MKRREQVVPGIDDPLILFERLVTKLFPLTVFFDEQNSHKSSNRTLFNTNLIYQSNSSSISLWIKNLLDQSYEIASKFIISVIEKYVDFTKILLTDTNYKDQLSRYFQKSFKVYPVYKHTKKNDKIFCEIIKDGKSIVTGYGDSKKKSEQDASHKALCFYNVLTT